jgi:hypothetical protein
MSATITPPPAEGVRLDWLAIPAAVRSAVEQQLGSAVEGAQSQPTGFSPGVAARLRLADGRGFFAKAVGPAPNPDSPAIHRREARIVAALPANVAVPRLVATYDEGENGWIVLVFEEVAGWHPAQPWRMDELDRVIAAMGELAEALTPSPLAASIVGAASDRFTTNICGWRRLAQEKPSHLDQLDGWTQRYLTRLIALEALAPASVAGETLLHFDIRADNLLLNGEQVWFVDWPHAAVGAAWVDVVGFAPSVAMQGGPPPEAVLARYPARHRAEPEMITAAIAAIAGYFTHRSLQPPPPGIPTVRAFQAAQGVVAREWVAQRMGWS